MTVITNVDGSNYNPPPKKNEKQIETTFAGRVWLHVEYGSVVMAKAFSHFSCVVKVLKIAVYSSLLFFKGLPEKMHLSLNNFISLFDDATRTPGDIQGILNGAIKQALEKGNYFDIPSTLLYATADVMGIFLFASATKIINLGAWAQSLGNVSVFGCKAFTFVTKVSLTTVYLATLEIGTLIDIASCFQKLNRRHSKEDNHYEQLYKCARALCDVAFLTLLIVGVTNLYIIAPLGILSATFGLIYELKVIAWEKMLPAQT
jgi:hypothetical protein